MGGGVVITEIHLLKKLSINSIFIYPALWKIENTYRAV